MADDQPPEAVTELSDDDLEQLTRHVVAKALETNSWVHLTDDNLGQIIKGATEGVEDYARGEVCEPPAITTEPVGDLETYHVSVEHMTFTGGYDITEVMVDAESVEEAKETAMTRPEWPDELDYEEDDVEVRVF